MRKKLIYLTLALAATASSMAVTPADADKPTTCRQVCCPNAPTICTECCTTRDGAEICGILRCPDA